MTRIPKTIGLFETHLTASDLDRSIEFYRDIVGLPLALVLEERGAAFFWIGGPGEVGHRPAHMSMHTMLMSPMWRMRGRLAAFCR